MLPKINIAKGHHHRFLRGNPWLFNNEIIANNENKSLLPGELVEVMHDGKPVAIGYFNRHSLISLRALTWDTKQTINANFFYSRLQNALTLREKFYTQPYYRLIHAEADYLPGLIIDRFDAIFVVQINTQGMERLIDYIVKALQALFDPKTIYIKRDSTIRTAEGLDIVDPEVIGAEISSLTIIENNTNFTIDISTGQKTSWFYDHRNNRKLIAELAHSKTVIDYFCYSGGFAIQAAMHGAKAVTGVDRSAPAIANATASAKLNNVDKICSFTTASVFEDLDKRHEDSLSYDIVVLDPPAFVKVKKDLKTGIKGYEKLLTKGLKLVNKQGLLLIASCSYHIKETDLKTCLAQALSNVNRTGSIIQRLTAGYDHPVHPHIEESEYLKGFLVFVD